ncbi:sigma factor-like helix-turn-helix DNA-binding protein [Acidobacteriota bacterium]
MARQRMTADQKAKMIALYRSGKPIPEIAKEIGLPFISVRQALFRARKRGELREVRKKGPAPKAKGEAVYMNRRTVVFLDEETRRTLKVAAVIKGVGMTEIVTEALREYFKRHPPKM